MASPEFVNVKIVGSPDLISDLESLSAELPNEFQILTMGPEKGTSYLQYAVGDVASVVAIVQGIYWAAELAKKLYVHLKHGKENRIVIQTPSKRIDLVSSAELTEAEVRYALDQLIGGRS
jgi:hypothetical protein